MFTVFYSYYHSCTLKAVIKTCFVIVKYPISPGFANLMSMAKLFIAKFKAKV